MQKGNLFLAAKFTSYRVNEQPVVYHRMNHMEYKSTFVIWIKEIMRYIPFINYFCNCEPT